VTSVLAVLIPTDHTSIVRASIRRAEAHPYLQWDGPIAFAHRGGAGEAPENTAAAFAAAVALGYRYLETDVHVTADGVLVAFHDDDLRRTCGLPGRISELPWSEVATARVEGREPIPRMDELLETWPDARWNIDCKTDRAVAPLTDAVRRHGALDRVGLSAFADRRIRALRRELGPRACTGAGQWELVALWAVGLRTGGALAAQVPPRKGWFGVVTERFIGRAHRRGMAVHVWTIDEPDEMHRLLDLGVDGLMTDRPTVLRDVLIARGAWRT
jgi:glycerophosphoryl diester phosphodiesterase